jgi:hypothetical protein
MYMVLTPENVCVRVLSIVLTTINLFKNDVKNVYLLMWYFFLDKMKDYFLLGIIDVYSINPIVNYVGCFKDSRYQRMLNGLVKPLTSSSMTIALCTNYCAEHDFHFAGLQFRYEIKV